MGKVRAIIVCLLILTALWAYPVWAADNTDVTIDATTMEYDVEAKAVTASGNVVLRGQNLEIRGDELVYYDNGWVDVPGKAFIKNDQGEFEGEGLHYNIKTQSGEIKNLQGQESGFYFKGETGTLTPEEETIQNGSVTRCDRPKPDYRLHASRISFREGHLIVERGYIEVLGIPILPILYLDLNLETLDEWPEFKAGSNKDRGLFVTALQRFTLSPHWNGYGQVGLGTEPWAQLGAGLTWQPTPALSFSGSASRDWSEADEENWRFAAHLNLWKNDEGQRVYAEGFREYRQAKDYNNGDQLYDGYLSGWRLNYSPQKDLTLGLGWVESEGDDRFYGDSGWGPEASLNWKQELGTNWAFRIKGSYRWGDDDERWLSKEISLTRYFHCISTTAGWDGVDEEWEFSVGVRW